MSYAIRIHENGGPEVLRYEEIEVAAPGPGQVRIRQSAIGVNYLDTYFRNGLYAAPNGLPLIPGGEGAGEIIAVGEGVTDVNVGDRVAYYSRIGAYATEVLMPADRVVKIPADVDDRAAAAVMLAGLTVWYLLRRTFPVKPEHTVLFHAAAGKVGLIAGQWLRHIGATSIGTAGGPDKVRLALENGYDHVIDYRKDDFVAEVLRITDGKKCHVVYDSVGKDTFPASLDCLRKLGMWVSFGQSSGPVPPFETSLLAGKGSIFATRPTLFDYAAERADLVEGARALFELVGNGTIRPSINHTYPLAEAAQAHRALEGRRTTGATILLP